MTIIDKPNTIGGQGGSSSQEHGAGVGIMAGQMMQEAAGKAIPAGYKQTELGVIPEDWEVVEFGQILIEFRNGYAFSASGYVKVGTPIITMAQIGLSGAFQFELSKLSRWDSSQLDQLKDFWVRNGDLLIAMTDVTPEKNLIGQMAIARLDNIALLNQRVGLLRLRADIAHAGYFSFLSCLSIWKSYCKGVASLGVQANIGTADIKKAKVYLPIIEEQTAIANVLSDTDALIGSLEQLIAKKQAIKSATMQQLLTGRTRLPAFAQRPDGTKKGYKPSELGDIPEDWEEISIGQDAVLKARIGWQALTTKEYQVSGDIYLVTGIDFDAGAVMWDKCCYVSEWRYKQDTNIQLRENDVLITKDGTVGKVGYVSALEKPATLNSGVFVIRPKNNSFVPRYLFYVLTSRLFNDFMNQITAGSTITHLYQKDFVNFEFSAPNIEEQTAIATILSDMDNELQALTQKLEKARALKQGMMQQLLTGKIRLPLAAGA